MYLDYVTVLYLVFKIVYGFKITETENGANTA